jgi:hypothetical protein
MLAYRTARDIRFAASSANSSRLLQVLQPQGKMAPCVLEETQGCVGKCVWDGTTGDELAKMASGDGVESTWDIDGTFKAYMEAEVEHALILVLILDDELSNEDKDKDDYGEDNDDDDDDAVMEDHWFLEYSGDDQGDEDGDVSVRFLWQQNCFR